jgi:general secretion pathway protein K
MNSRLAYNYVDGLKAYYSAKAGFKFSLVRLKGYQLAKKFLDDPAQKDAKSMMPPGMLEQIWSMPIRFPLLPLPNMTVAQTASIKDFNKEGKIPGDFTANITSESAKLNLNNLFGQIPVADTGSGSSSTPGAKPTPAPAATPTAAAGSPEETQKNQAAFRELLESTIDQKLAIRRNDDRDFADSYRNVYAKDIVDAILAYLFPDRPASNLPGFRPLKAKQAPFYSLTELHLIPGIDDELYNMLEPLLTVYTTSGINVNKLSKASFLSLLPGLTPEGADAILAVRDDPQVGKPWDSDQQFWKDVGEKGFGGKDISQLKQSWEKASLKPIFTENSFKISVSSNVGMATKHLEAFVVLTNPPNQPGANSSGGQNPQNPSAGPAVPAAQPTPNAASPDGSSGKKTNGVNLLYWRMI